MPDELRGRVMGIFMVAHIGVFPVGHFIGGVLGQTIGAPNTLHLTSVMIFLFGVFNLWNRVPEIDSARNLELGSDPLISH